MKDSKLFEAARTLSAPYQVTNGKKIRLKSFDPGDTWKLDVEDKARAMEALMATE